MTFIVSHNIPLSRQTIDAWKGEGGVVLKRRRSAEYIYAYLVRHPEIEFVLNLGDVIEGDTVMGFPVINPGNVVAPLWTPGNTRRILDSVLPPQPEPGNTDWWEKSIGRAGIGKYRRSYPYPERNYGGSGIDFQVHIEGPEYRVITVGGRIVQQYQRSGPNGDRRYQWLRRDALPDLITDVIARATRDLGTYTLVAWDTIQEDEHWASEPKAYILEGNCCPGVKTPTAARIVNAVRRLISA